MSSAPPSQPSTSLPLCKQAEGALRFRIEGVVGFGSELETQDCTHAFCAKRSAPCGAKTASTQPDPNLLFATNLRFLAQPTPQDALLLRCVAKHGPKNWSVIARSIPGRTGKSCRLR